MLSKIIAEDLISRLSEAIAVKEDIVITCHSGPDGDAIGSSLALCHYLRRLGKRTQVVVPDSFPQFLSWMPGAAEIVVFGSEPERARELFDRADLVFALDLNASHRLGRLEQVFVHSTAPKIVIDHHPHPEGFAQLVISYPEMSSTAEMIFRLICRMGHFEHVTLQCAQCIYTGMMTDTGNFSYHSNHPELYYIIGGLLKLGIDKDDIYQKVYYTYTHERLKLYTYSLYRKLKLYPKYRTAAIVLSREDLARFDYQPGDTEGIVNVPLSIQGVVLSVLMREEADRVKISFRSRGAFPVNRLAAELFEGGGHLNAAGAESRLSLHETLKLFKKALPAWNELLQNE